MPLTTFLPPPAATPSPIQRRAALASTLVAGLELARDGVLRLEQHVAFEEITATLAGAKGLNAAA